MRGGRPRPGDAALATLASCIVVVLLVAAGAVVVRTSPGARTLAFVGGSSTLAATPTAASAPAPPPGPLSNPQSLDAALAAIGYRVPTGANVYAAKITRTPAGLSYDDYQAGGGALGAAFWPASSIKVLAAVGALEFANKLGFTGAATVSFAGGGSWTIKSIYDAAIRVSSNPDYDLLVQIAGVDWLNKEFLTAARGFPVTVIQRSYGGINVMASPAITLTEGGRKTTVPARTGHVDTDCAQGNCSNLFEMSESVRRVVLNDEIPEPERFHIDRADVAGLSGDLLAADGWFEPAINRVLGAGARIYSKPGYVTNLDCMDVTLIDAKGKRLLLAATVPDAQGGCAALVNLAAGVLRVLSS
jgi:hypothetical protein